MVLDHLQQDFDSVTSSVHPLPAKLDRQQQDVNSLNKRLNSQHRTSETTSSAPDSTSSHAIDPQRQRSHVATAQAPTQAVNRENESSTVATLPPTTMTPGGNNRRSVNDVKRSTSIEGNVPKNLPALVHALVEEHHTFGLGAMQNHRLKGWNRKIKMAYLRRNYMYDEVKRRMNTPPGENMIRTAKTMDSERDSLGLTLPQYIEHLKANDSRVHKRKQMD